MEQQRGFATRAIHGARFHGPGKGQPIVFPLFQTASFAFASAEEQAEVGGGREAGFAYSRVNNPTTDAFHRVLADLEGGAAALSFASGIAAIHAAMVAVVGAGEHIVATQQVYGGTYNLLSRTLPRFGITHTFADLGRDVLQSWHGGAGSARAGRGGAYARRAASGGQHIRHPVPGTSAR